MPPSSSGPLTAEEARAAAETRVFFGHQSIGGNVIKGINSLYTQLGVTRPASVNLDSGPAAAIPAGGGVLADAHVGDNGRPIGKLAEFEQLLRSGVGARVDVAFIKFCYADIRGARGADYASVDELFNAYVATMTRLERDFPDITFLYTTAPVENADIKGEDIAEYNANRARYNALIRNRYAGTGRLWDVAKAESTAPDGSRVTTTYNGATHEALYGGYTLDGGHLYEDGTRVVATPLLRLLARVG